MSAPWHPSSLPEAGERSVEQPDTGSPVPTWVGSLVTPGFWVLALVLTLGQALALYSAGVASGRFSGPALTWPVDLNFAQGPVGWLLVASLLVAARQRGRNAVTSRVGLVLGLLSLAAYIVTWLWVRPDGRGWWTLSLGLGVIVHAFALYLIGLLALERDPSRTRTTEVAPAPTQEPTPTGPPPVWQPGAAAGRAWSRAGDAATGAGPSHVGRPESERELGGPGSPNVDTRQLGPSPNAGYQVPLPGQSAPAWQRSGSPWPGRDESDPETTLRRPPASPYPPPSQTRD